MADGLILSIFPGVDLLGIPFEELGYCVVRGPDVLWGGDIRRFHPPAGAFWGVIGGPPCQTFSQLAHLVRANGHEPKFGNLIPEYERAVSEAGPAWFLMENVPGAPTPVVDGYIVRSFLLDNRWVGGEQMRRRRFSFGTRDGRSLLRYLEVVALEEPIRYEAVIRGNRSGNGSEYYDRMDKAVTSNVGGDRRARKEYHFREWQKTGQAVTAAHAGGIRYRRTDQAILGSNRPPGVRDADNGVTYRKTGQTVTSTDGGEGKGKRAVKQVRYSIPEAIRLQGLPEGFLADAPFTKDGKLKAIANGVPLPLGRAVALAIQKAMADD